MTADYLTDSWRWWAAGGAAVGLFPMVQWVKYLIRTKTAPNGTGIARVAGGLAMVGFLIAILIAGALIPLARLGRVNGFTQESPAYIRILAAAWLLFGIGTWGVAISFARSHKRMIVVCFAWWFAMAFATYSTVGMAA